MNKVKSLHEQNKLELIAIDEAHLIYEWDGFREHYQQCETLPRLTILMYLNQTLKQNVRLVQYSLHCSGFRV